MFQGADCDLLLDCHLGFSWSAHLHNVLVCRGSGVPA